MSRFLIDANLSFRIAVWKGEKFCHVIEIDDEWTDSEIWDHARKNDHTIITKDADFSNRIILSKPPPRVIHFRIGNMKLRDMEKFINEHWKVIQKASASHKLVNEYRDRIETFE